MLKETETEETIIFFVTFLSFQLGGGEHPRATPMQKDIPRKKFLETPSFVLPA